MINKFDRRKQPSNTIKAIGVVLKEINWQVKEVTQQKFTQSCTDGTSVNESFGYAIQVPGKLPIKKLWVGYIDHQSLSAGIYTGLTPDMASGPELVTPHKIGYRLVDFGEYLLMKRLLPMEKIQELENKLGFLYLVKEYKNILKKIYPFNSK